MNLTSRFTGCTNETLRHMNKRICQFCNFELVRVAVKVRNPMLCCNSSLKMCIYAMFSRPWCHVPGARKVCSKMSVSGRVPAAYCWTLVLLSMSQMTTRNLCCLEPFIFISNTTASSSRLSISSPAYVYLQPKYSPQQGRKVSMPRQLLPREGLTLYCALCTVSLLCWTEIVVAKHFQMVHKDAHTHVLHWNLRTLSRCFKSYWTISLMQRQKRDTRRAILMIVNRINSTGLLFILYSKIICIHFGTNLCNVVIIIVLYNLSL